MIAVLFARKDSVYKSMPGCDVYDKDRNALAFTGECSVIAHPPCRAWATLRAFAKPEIGEKELALWAVDMVRRTGGVLEHPRGSLLWKEKNIPAPGCSDDYGFTVQVNQFWFGHKAEKATWLYVCGLALSEIPPFPLRFALPGHVVGTRKRGKGRLPEISKADRERTPRQFAYWLKEIADKSRRAYHEKL